MELFTGCNRTEATTRLKNINKNNMIIKPEGKKFETFRPCGSELIG